MKTIFESSEEIYKLIGEGYGFNGSREDALKIIQEKITDVAKQYSDKAFVAGRSKQTWESFVFEHFEDWFDIIDDKKNFAIGFAEWMMQNRWYNTSTNQDGLTLYYQQYTHPTMNRVFKPLTELLELYKSSLNVFN